MDLGLKGKKALVTGAGRGLGRSIALGLAEEGCIVTAISRNQDELIQLVNEMKLINGAKHDYYTLDLSYEIPIYNEYDIVVNNVGGGIQFQSEQNTLVKDALVSKDDYLRAWELNVGIAIKINNNIIPYMKKKRWGRIIHISSIGGECLRGSIPYACSKAYLTRYSKMLSRALCKDNIIVSCVLPGAFYDKGNVWDENNPINSDKKKFKRKLDEFLKNVQMCGRLGKVEEIVPFVLLLASEHATFASGATINVDGGHF